MLLILMPMVSHDQKSHVALLLKCLDLGNSVVPFMMVMPIASHDQKSHVGT